MATSAWGASFVYLECNKSDSTIEQIPTWLGIKTVNYSNVTERTVHMYGKNNVENHTTLKISFDDTTFRWTNYILDRTTLKLSRFNHKLARQCIIYPWKEWKDRKSAYLEGIEKKRKL